MGVMGGCAAVVLMWWAQAPLLTALERPPGAEAQPGQLLHPLYLQLDTPAPRPRAHEDGARWALESVTVELDGQRLVEDAAPGAANEEPIVAGGSGTGAAHIAGAVRSSGAKAQPTTM